MLFEKLKKISPGNLESAGIIRRAKTFAGGYPTYICEECGNGSGKDGDGLTVTEYDWGFNYRCFKEGKNYTAVDLIAAHFCYDAETTAGLAETARKAKELFSWLADDSECVEKPKVDAQNPPENEKHEPEKKPVQEKPKNDYSAEIKIAQDNLPEFIQSVGGRWRGLSLETLKKFGCGFNPEWLNIPARKIPNATKTPRLIIPTSKFHYLARLTEPHEKFQSAKDFQYLNEKIHVGEKEIFGEILEKAEFVIVVEGEIDAMSIWQVSGGKYSVIACGGTSGKNKAKEYLKAQFGNLKEKPSIIILFDNDSNLAGQKAAKEFSAELKELDFQTAIEFIDEKKDYDINEILQSEGEKILAEKVEKVLTDAQDKIGQAKMKNLGEKSGFVLQDYFRYFFREDIEKNDEYGKRKTGFSNLDENQIFLPGLYVIGGLPGIGKTTFVWQMLEQLALNGETCIYCGYEMSKLELFSKTFSRRLFSQGKKELTSADIRRGKFDKSDKKVCELLNSLDNDPSDLRILELENENADDLIEKLKNICANLEFPPIIAIDYLQIIPLPKNNDSLKSGIDYTVKKFKDFQRKTGTTFIVISSFNRQNYSSSVSFKSFKESGGIEYAADVVWGMQFDLKGQNPNDETIDLARKKYPREIELKCLKNRSGGFYDCKFLYYSANDYFEPKIAARRL